MNISLSMLVEKMQSYLTLPKLKAAFSQLILLSLVALALLFIVASFPLSPIKFVYQEI